MRRVVITGLGMVAPTGNNVQEAWDAALSCRSGVGRLSLFDLSAWPDLNVHIAAEVKGLDPRSFMQLKEARHASRFVCLTAAAMKEVVADAGLDLSGDTRRIGCAIGVGLGAFSDIEVQAQKFKERGPRRVSPSLLPYAIPNMAAGYAAMTHNLQGPNFCTASACASGTHALGEAWLQIQFGTADVMFAGGAEAAISPMSMSCFARMRALSTRNDAPQTASRPFDLERDGFVIGEGCAMLVLEELEHARRRGAKIYAEFAGYGLSCDAHHMTALPAEGTGAIRCMQMALEQAQLAPEQIDYINAHGTSTQANDAIESLAIEKVFGPHVRQLSISSTKGVTGHCLGAAGAIEGVYTVLAIQQSVAPPTANLRTPDPACRLDYTPHEPRQRSIRYALSNSFGFGGHNACIAFKRFE